MQVRMLKLSRPYAFVGGSFTAGFHGGKPWVPALRKDMQADNTEIYNLGASGTGVEHLYRLLKSVEKELKITHILILAISDDFRQKILVPTYGRFGNSFLPRGSTEYGMR